MRLIAALLLAAIPATPAAADPSDHPHVEPLRAGAAILFGTSCNVVVVPSAHGLLLVDDQRPGDHAETLALLRARWRQPVVAVINTHFHLDHAGGDAAFARGGATVLAQAEVQRRLSEPGFVTRFRQKLPDAGPNPWPQRSYAERMTLRFGNETLRLVHVPHAHTDGDTLVRLTRANVLHMGDVFFNGLYPHIDTDNGGTIQGNIAAVDLALRMSDAGTRIVPGHGPIATRAELAAFGRMLVDVAADVRRQIAAGHDLAAVLASRPAARYALDGDADQFVTAVYKGYTPA